LVVTHSLSVPSESISRFCYVVRRLFYRNWLLKISPQWLFMPAMVAAHERPRKRNHMDSSPVTPPPANLRYNLQAEPQAVSEHRSEASMLSSQDPAKSPRMVSRLSARLIEFESPDEDSSGDFSFDDLMIGNDSDRPENAPGWLQYLPPLSVHCCNALAADSLSTVRELLLSGEDIHQTDPTFGRTPLHWACIFSSAAMVELLLRHGALDDINQYDALGLTPLACLVTKRDLPGHEVMVHALLSAGAHLELVEACGHSLMFTDYLTPALAGALLQKGLNIDCTNGLRETPLQVAAARDSEALVEFLLVHGADPHRRCMFGCTALNNGQLSEGVAARLIRCGAQVNTRDDLGQTPLMLACYFNNIPLVRLLVAHEASLDIKSQTGWTAVDYARNLGGEVYRVILESAGLIPGTRLAQS